MARLALTSGPIVDPAHHIEFMKVYASSLLLWQIVEQNLFLLFSHIVQSSSKAPVTSAIYHSIINFSTRLSMIDEAMKMVYLNKPELGEWKKLTQRVDSMSRNRNRIAHSTLKVHKETKTGKKSFRLASSIFDLRDGKDSEYTLSQMKDWQDKFAGLAFELSDFLRKVGASVPKHRPEYFT